MKLAPSVILATVLTVPGISCGGSPSPAGPSSQALSLAGAWNGTGTDSQGATTVTWALTQSGANVSGTVKTQAVNPTDGSCNSCHRNKTGTVSGTLTDTTLMLTMFFAAGGAGDPTPICAATLSGTASSLSADKVDAVYSGTDSCEGPFMNGFLAMTRRP